MNDVTELERLAARDSFGATFTAPAGEVTILDLAGRGFVAPLRRDVSGNLYTQTPVELMAVNEMAPPAAPSFMAPPPPPDHARVLVLDPTGRLLLLRRSDDGTWEPVEGRLDDADARAAGDATALDTAQRELGEEAAYGGPDLTWIKLADRTWVVQLPPDADDPVLSAEHTDYQWVSGREAARWLAASASGGYYERQQHGREKRGTP